MKNLLKLSRFKDMFIEFTINKLIACCLLPAIAICLIYLSLLGYLDFSTLSHKVIASCLILLLIWQVTIFLGFFLSLLARVIYKDNV